MPVDPQIVAAATDAAMKAIDRCVSAYERSCEIELEKEKVKADLKIGLRKIGLEEKELDAKFKAAMRLIDIEEKKLDACIREMDAKVGMSEQYMKAMLAKSDTLLKLMCETTDEGKRQMLQSLWIKVHEVAMAHLTSTSDGFNKMLSASGKNLVNAAKLGKKQLPLSEGE